MLPSGARRRPSLTIVGKLSQGSELGTQVSNSPFFKTQGRHLQISPLSCTDYPSGTSAWGGTQSRSQRQRVDVTVGAYPARCRHGGRMGVAQHVAIPGQNVSVLRLRLLRATKGA